MITMADIIMTDMNGQDIPILALPEKLPSHEGLELELGADNRLRLRSGETVMVEISDVDDTVLALLSDYANIPVLEVPPGAKSLPDKLSMMADIVDNRAG